MHKGCDAPVVQRQRNLAALYQLMMPATLVNMRFMTPAWLCSACVLLWATLVRAELAVSSSWLASLLVISRRLLPPWLAMVLSLSPP
jgi:hypothetical protein